jgi:hypothetical protein
MMMHARWSNRTSKDADECIIKTAVCSKCDPTKLCTLYEILYSLSHLVLYL